MGRPYRLQFQEFEARKIVNVHKHVDPWFWTKYSAHPYIGCRSGCEFCYLRGGRYLGRRDPATFDTLIQVKTNAAELLRRELTRRQPDVIACGDWQQPAEDRYQLSRRMLEVVLEMAFPLFVVERSPSVTRDIDLIVEINRQTWVGIVMSISSLDPRLKRAFEPRSPGVKRRLQAMEKLASAGILVGTALMPVFPAIGDGDQHLEEVIRATRGSGGSFVLAGGLTMDGVQAERSLAAAQQLGPNLDRRWRQFYNWSDGKKPEYGPPANYQAQLGLRVRELCLHHGLGDRLPRYISKGLLAVNKRIAEKLALKMYDLELAQAKSYRIWAYRRAAWAVDETASPIDELYRRDGLAGLEALPGIGKRLAREIAGWIDGMRPKP